jgi:homoserine kinase
MSSNSLSAKMDTRSVKVTAPGTIANIVCGYDVMGLALDAPYDEVEITLNDSGIVSLSIIGDGGMLPTDVDKNVASAIVKYFLTETEQTQIGAEVVLYKHMPLNSGMGSSSASTVAALVGINHLTGNKFSRADLLPFAVEGERIACGNAHADNVAPALLGGVVLVRSHHPLDAVALPFPANLNFAVVHPHIEVPTSDSRRILKSRISIPEAVTQWGNVGGLVAGFCLRDTALIGRSLKDVIFEPVRSMLIPGFYEMKKIAMDQGAIGFGISGSGPSVFAMTDNAAMADTISKLLSDFLKSIGIGADSFTSRVNAEGAKVL